MARFPFIAVFTLLLFFVVEGPSRVEGGPLSLSKVKLTKEQEEAVNKVDGLLNQLLNNIRQYYLEKNPHLKPDPFGEYPEENYPEESYGKEDNLDHGESNDAPASVPKKVDNGGGLNEGVVGQKEGEKEGEVWVNESNDAVDVASDNDVGKEQPFTGEEGHVAGGNLWDDGRIIFPNH